MGRTKKDQQYLDATEAYQGWRQHGNDQGWRRHRNVATDADMKPLCDGGRYEASVGEAEVDAATEAEEVAEGRGRERGRGRDPASVDPPRLEPRR